MQVYDTESGKNETKFIGDLLLWDVSLNFEEGYVPGEPECLLRNDSAADDRKSASRDQSVYGNAGKAASMELRGKAKRVEFSHI
ncbi:hypothetical protein T12_8980 [Trichinella patagoniensis]|uniref:Uncharacterized protein n=1 Tax=Trichinella patagoniensis TaxID=990121 RepID=A0A0V1A1Z8_9BILA|nr:hypothetical protein T12_8980 [Trichinella patagoniensis]